MLSDSTGSGKEQAILAEVYNFTGLRETGMDSCVTLEKAVTDTRSFIEPEGQRRDGTKHAGKPETQRLACWLDKGARPEKQRLSNAVNWWSTSISVSRVLPCPRGGDRHATRSVGRDRPKARYRGCNSSNENGIEDLGYSF